MRWIVVVAVLVARTAHGDDWAPTRDPFDPVVVARYRAILDRDPYDASALAKLVELYRKYRTIDRLVHDLGDDWAGLVVRARLARSIGNAADARALWTRAVGEH